MQSCTPQNGTQNTLSCSRENWCGRGGILQRRTGKKHAMQHPLQFRAIHVNNCFLFQWKCTARQGKQYFLPIKRKSWNRPLTGCQKIKLRLPFFFGKQMLFTICYALSTIYGGKRNQIVLSQQNTKLKLQYFPSIV